MHAPAHEDRLRPVCLGNNALQEDTSIFLREVLCVRRVSAFRFCKKAEEARSDGVSSFYSPRHPIRVNSRSFAVQILPPQ